MACVKFFFQMIMGRCARELQNAYSWVREMTSNAFVMRQIYLLFLTDLASLSQAPFSWRQNLPYFGDFCVESRGFSGNFLRLPGIVESFGPGWNFRNLCNGEGLEDALCRMEFMDQQGVQVSKDVTYFLLQGCIRKKDFVAGRRVHSVMINRGLDSMSVLADRLIQLYTFSGSLVEGNQVFCKVSKPSVHTWNAIILAHAKLRENGRTIELYLLMQQHGLLPEKRTFFCILLACGSTRAEVLGRRIHEAIIKNGFESHIMIGNLIVDMYSKCGCLEEACDVFHALPTRNVASWCAIILGFAQHGQGSAAIELFEKMMEEGIEPSNMAFLGILKACSSTKAVGKGRLIHDQIIKNGLEADSVIGNSLLGMYAKCGSLDEARSVFETLSKQNVVTWGAMVTGYAQHGHGDLALGLFEDMQQQGVKPNRATFLAVLKACSNIESLEQGRLIHHQIKRSELKSDENIGSSLVDMYAKCGSLEEASEVFEHIRDPDVVSWGAMISGYAEHGLGVPALNLFEKMQEEGIKPNKVILLSILKACGTIKAIKKGRIIHGHIVRSGLELDIIVGNTLVDMYVKCESLEEAYRVFNKLTNQTVVSWSAMIVGHTVHDDGILALENFEKMKQDGIKPDKVTLSCMLKACSSKLALLQGRLVHEEIIKSGLSSDVVVGTALVDMYCKCGSLEEARQVFDEVPKQSIVSWGAMISGYAQHGHGFLALELFEEIQKEGIWPNRVTSLCALKACGSIWAIRQGRWIHDLTTRSGFESEVAVWNTIVDMYSKCGCLEESQKLFDKLLDPDVVSWAAMIAGYAEYGNHTMVWHCLKAMRQQGLKPNAAIFANILSACSHLGQLDEGCQCFTVMIQNYDKLLSIEHYSCMIDLLGRTGHLKEAEDLLEMMPITPNRIVWMSLLTSCRTYGSLQLGRRCFDEVVQLNPDDASGYVLMSNIYAEAKNWENLDKIDELRKCVGALRKPGRACIEVDKKVHEFIVGAQSHPQGDVSCVKLTRLSRQVKKDGHVPQVDIVLESMVDEEIEEAIPMLFGCS